MYVCIIKPLEFLFFCLVPVIDQCQFLISVSKTLIFFSYLFRQCTSKNAAQKEMYTLALKNYPIPGDPAFPLNALYAKPQKGPEEGKFI